MEMPAIQQEIGEDEDISKSILKFVHMYGLAVQKAAPKD